MNEFISSVEQTWIKRGYRNL